MSPAAAPNTAALAACSLHLSPSGHLILARGDPSGVPLPQRTADRIEESFRAGTGHGLLSLGLEEPSGELGPAIGYWRDLAKLFLTKLCRLLDLNEAVASGLDVALDDGEATQLLDAAPPMVGIEYLSMETLRGAWKSLEEAFIEESRASGRDAESFLKSRHSIWSAVGRVFLHLAENKARSDLPFAFLATYTARVSSQGKLQHVPLGKAVQAHAAAQDRSTLLSVLLPVQRAAAEGRFLKELVDSGRIFQPQAWSPAEAHSFLRETDLYERHGIFVRVPDWWSARNPPRLQVAATVGGATPAGLGADALLDFSVALSLEGEPLSKAEWESVLAGTGDLALVKGRWVEVDREKLKDLLGRWKAIEKEVRRGGLSFLDGMRLMARLPGGGPGSALDGRDAAADAASPWLSVDAGEWLRRVLEELRSPSEEDFRIPAEDLRATLRPYQADGVKWLRLLHKLRLGGCLADDMGLGKTIQVLSLLVLLKREAAPPGVRRSSLLVIPASLIGNWKSECARFTPGLRVLVAHPSEPGGAAQEAPSRLEDFDLVITTYGMLSRLAWIEKVPWRLAVLDEAQAIKNPGARQTQAVKAIRSWHRIALTGTPVENRLGDLWSLFDFLSPGLLGSAKEFSRLAKGDGGPGAEVYARIRSLVRPYLLRRLKTDKRIIADLPDKQEVKVFCGLRKTQAALYQQGVDALARVLRDAEGIQRRGTILAFLMRFKQICNHPSQWTGDRAYDPTESGKTARLLELCEEIAARQDKALVFTQFKEITGMLAGILEPVFGRAGLVLDGDTPVKKRKEIVEQFQLEAGPPYIVLSLRAGGIGLNLTAASHVIHFDRWWNPAVENQATDRAYRIGQKRNVLVHKFVCQGTIEEKIDELLEAKQFLSDEILRDGAEAVLTEMTNEELMRFVALDKNKASVDS